MQKKYFLEAANRDDPDSQYFLGRIYEDNDDVECIEWYEKALSNGDIYAAVNLVSIYLEGKLTYKNPEKVDYYLRIISDSQNADAMISVVRLYYIGTHDRNNKDINKAIIWCKKAIECGSVYGVSNLLTLYKKANLNIDEYYKYLNDIHVKYNK